MFVFPITVSAAFKLVDVILDILVAIEYTADDLTEWAVLAWMFVITGSLSQIVGWWHSNQCTGCGFLVPYTLGMGAFCELMPSTPHYSNMYFPWSINRNGCVGKPKHGFFSRKGLV